MPLWWIRAMMEDAGQSRSRQLFFCMQEARPPAQLQRTGEREPLRSGMEVHGRSRVCGNWLMTAWRKGLNEASSPVCQSDMPFPFLPCGGKRLKVTQTGLSPVGLGEGESLLCVMYTKISIQMDSTPKCEKPITQVLFKERMRGYLEDIRGERIFLNKMQKTDHKVWGWYIWLP